MLADQLGIGHDPGQHAAYVNSWIKVLQHDPKEILRAARDADKISGYVLAFDKERVPTNVEKLPKVDRPAAREAPPSAPEPRRVRTAGGRER
jgi:antirestriction protein ArdC